MHQIDLKAIDLNLLVVLDVLLTERSVSRAARHLGRSQSAVSHSLARLRDLLADPVLVRTGRSMTPSPRAEAIAEPLRRVLHDAERVLAQAPGFDPATSARRFTLLAPDALGVILPELLAALAARAPGVSLELRAVPPSIEGALAEGAADLALAPLLAAAPALRARRLGTLGHHVVLRRHHPALTDGRLDLAGYLAWPHVVVRTPDPGPSLVGTAIQAAGHSRRVGLAVPSFLMAPTIVGRSELLFTCPGALVAPVADALGLVLVPVPVPIPEVPVAALWHVRLHEDAGHRWFRKTVAEELRRWLSELG